MEKTIEEQKHIIDKFMGSDKFEDTCNTGFGYHNSWEVIMTVLEKIESLGFKTRIDYSINQLFKIWDDPDGNPIVHTQNETKLTVVYNGVVQFLTWYNQQ